MAKRIRVEMEAFVKAWEASTSVKEVSDKLGIKVTSVMARASKYRSAPLNIPLKGMQRGGGAKVNSEAAKNLLATLRGLTLENVQAESVKLADKHIAKAAAKAATTV